MKHDELIDDVARQMTAVDGRPALRERVLASIETTSTPERHNWWMPAAIGSALAMGLFVWVLTPGVSDQDGTPTAIARQDLVLTPEMVDEARGAEIQAPQPSSAMSHMRRIRQVTTDRTAIQPIMPRTVVDVGPTDVRVDAMLRDFPTLPRLPALAPIAVATLVADEAVIAPLSAGTVQLTAISIDPLNTSPQHTWSSFAENSDGL